MMNFYKLYYWYFIKKRGVLFDHLPKCAGSTVNNFLREHYPEKLIYSIHGGVPKKSITEFKSMPILKRYSYQLIYGHLALDLVGFVDDRLIRVVVFREPVDRIVSHYYFVKRSKNHYLYEFVEKNIPLASYCQIENNEELQNCYVQHFSGFEIAEIYKNPDLAVDTAYNRIIEVFDLIGFQDSLSTFIDKLSKMANFSTRKADIKKSNITIDRPKIDTLTMEERQSIENANSLDIALYNRLLKKRENGLIVNSR